MIPNALVIKSQYPPPINCHVEWLGLPKLCAVKY